MTKKELCSLIDHTNLKAYAVREDFVKLCEEARQYQFAMVAINSAPVALCAELLKGSGVQVGAAIGFPLGQTSIENKVHETVDAIKNGANEIDYVIHIGMLKDRELSYIEREMRSIVEACQEQKIISKVIFENCYLSDEEKKILCGIALKIKPDFIKTSTGMGPGGATAEDVRLMKNLVGNEIKVKASGGVRTLSSFLAMVEAGAERIGTSSGIDICRDFTS